MRSKILHALILTAIACLCHPLDRNFAQSNQPMQQREALTTWPAKAKRWALIIGVDQYIDPQISPVRAAGSDAKQLADSLVRYAGFPPEQVVLMASDQPAERQPTRLNILQRLAALSNSVPVDGLLLISFVGHGVERNGQAYLVTSDSHLANLEESTVSVSRMRDRIRESRVRQVVVFLDACRTDPGRLAGDPNTLNQIFLKGFEFDVTNREVRAFATLYATAVGECGYESSTKNQGYFTSSIIEALKGAAANDKGEVRLASLVKFVEENVPKRVASDLGPDKQQRPFDRIAGYNAEELVIAGTATVAAVSSPTPVPPPPINAMAIELSYWDSIKNSNDAADYKSYLATYPNGQFAELAQNRLRRLGGQPGTPANSRPANVSPAGKQPPVIDSLTASTSQINLPCPAGEVSDTCAVSPSTLVQLGTSAKSPGGNSLLYSYTVSGGRITGDGPNVTWDLAGVAPGSYTVSVQVNDGRGGAASASTTVRVSECTGCVDKIADVVRACPAAVNVECTAEPIKEGTPATFTAHVEGGPGKQTYNWAISAGTISSGQGTTSITVDTTGLSGRSVTAMVELGPDPSCKYRTASCTVSISSPAKPPPNPTAGSIVKNRAGLEMVYVPAGSFMMGSSDAEVQAVAEDAKRQVQSLSSAPATVEKPTHKVAIREGFYMGRYDVTQSQWRVLMGSNPSSFKDCGSCPVENISWNDAEGFIQKLNQMNDGFVYRLPSEAEWEYACRAGTTTAFAFGDTISSDQANFNGKQAYGTAAQGPDRQKTMPVGSFRPNTWGLYDMHGNVWNFCEDYWHDSYTGAPADGSAWLNGGEQGFRILRGGSWATNGDKLRSSARAGIKPDDRTPAIGIRVVAVARAQ